MELTKQQELFKTIIEKSWKDEAFRQELIANPLETIEKETGVKMNIPEGKTFVVKDQTDESKVYFNIPAKPNFENMELNEQQLEAVAGGSFPWFGPGNLFSVWFSGDDDIYCQLPYS